MTDDTLAGGLESPPERLAAPGAAHLGMPPHPPPGTRHDFDPISGWCPCGLRDDGKTVPGSPVRRAQISA